MLWLKLILIFMTLNVVRSQIWEGNYTADATCSAASCCCIGPNVEINRIGNSRLRISLGLNGQCLGQTSYSGDGDYPSSFTFTASMSIVSMTATLTGDSNTLTITISISPGCLSRLGRINPFSTTTALTTVRSGSISDQKNTYFILVSMILKFICHWKKFYLFCRIYDCPNISHRLFEQQCNSFLETHNKDSLIYINFSIFFLFHWIGVWCSFIVI